MEDVFLKLQTKFVKLHHKNETNKDYNDVKETRATKGTTCYNRGL